LITIQLRRASMAATTILVVDDEPLICAVIADFFQIDLDVRVECAYSGPEAAGMIGRKTYNLALIDASILDPTGLDLAVTAANRNTPVLLLTGRPEINFRLRQFDYPHLAKPFTLDALRAETSRVMIGHAENIARVRQSAAHLMANMAALNTAMAESDRLLDAVRRHQQLGRWATAKPVTIDAGAD
jgi:DNA-binding response OmpR family regulator